MMENRNNATLVAMDRKHAAQYVLIGSLAFVFGYFGIDKFLSPLLWIGWIPEWLNGALGASKETWLRIIGVIEILSAIGLLLPIRRLRQLACIGMMLQLLGILSQTGWNDVAARDINILLSALALLLML